jgi:hypothetical protein
MYISYWRHDIQHNNTQHKTLSIIGLFAKIYIIDIQHNVFSFIMLSVAITKMLF